MNAKRQPPNIGQFLSALSEPWFILPRAFDAMWAAAMAPESLLSMAPEDNAPRYDAPVDGVAVIPIYGPINRRPQSWEKEYLGVTAQAEIADELNRAMNDSAVRAVLLDFDSPGGHAIGNPELAAHVAALDARKPVVAFTSGLMASAAYYLASQCSVIVATSSAQVGCIGTVLSWLDVSAYFAQLGVKREVIVNEGATFKGMGLPGTSLTDEQRAHLQDQVTKMGDGFKAAVRTKRRVPDDAMRGQCLFGDQALKARLVDQLGNFGAAYKTAALMGTKRIL